MPHTSEIRWREVANEASGICRNILNTAALSKKFHERINDVLVYSDSDVKKLANQLLHGDKNGDFANAEEIQKVQDLLNAVAVMVEFTTKFVQYEDTVRAMS